MVVTVGEDGRKPPRGPKREWLEPLLPLLPWMVIAATALGLEKRVMGLLDN